MISGPDVRPAAVFDFAKARESVTISEMRQCLLVLFIVFELLATQVVVAAPRKSCGRALLDLQEVLPAKVWSSDSPIELTSQDGRKFHLTFSNDTEVPLYDLFRILQSDPASFKALENLVSLHLGKFRARELASLLGMSQKQFKIFGLRKGVDPELKKFLITDLNPKQFALICEKLIHQRRAFKEVDKNY